MRPVAWTPEALARLDDTEAYITNNTPTVAKEVITRLLQRSRQLETAPHSGRTVAEYQREDLRELLEQPYRIIYRITTAHIEILTVMHYRQLLPRKAEALQKK